MYDNSPTPCIYGHYVLQIRDFYIVLCLNFSLNVLFNYRLYKPNHGITSSRQEKALKIYMDNIPNSNSASNKESV